MTVVQTGMLWIKAEDIPDEYVYKIVEAYTYQHPKEPDQKFTTIVMLHDRIGIPAGDIGKLKAIVPNIKIIDKRIVEPLDRPINITGLELRDYQETALEQTLDYLNNGGSAFNLAGSPGSGKSVMLSAILAKLNVKTLIIAHLSMLTTQLKKEIEQFTDAKVVVLDTDNLELGDINIATSQFISRRSELWYKIKKGIGLIVVDEAETIASETTLRILQRAHAKYRIAISATFTRSVDGRTPALLDMIGDKVVTLENSALLKPTIIGVNCDEYFEAPRNKNLYKKKLISFFKNNTTIDDKILSIVQGSLKKHRQVLIACDLNEFQDRYTAMLEANGIRCGIMNGSTNKNDRAKFLEDYDNGTIDVLLGFGVLNAGLSIPHISTIIRVSTPSNLEKLEQLIGRARRDFEGKEGAFIVDLMFRGFNNANKARQRFYKDKVIKEDWKFVMSNWERFERKLNE